MPRPKSTRRRVPNKIQDEGANIPENTGSVGAHAGEAGPHRGDPPDAAFSHILADCGRRFGWRDPPSEIISPMAGYTSGVFGVAGVHTKRIFDLAFSPVNGSLLASASDDDTASVWQHDPNAQARRNWKQAACLVGHSDCVLRVSWAQQPDLLATASADGSAALWRVQPAEGVQVLRQPLQAFKGHPEEVYACEVLASAGGKQLLTASAESLFVWDIESGRLLNETRHGKQQDMAAIAGGPPLPPDPTRGYVFGAREAAGSGLLAAPCSDGVLRLWEASSGAAKPLSALKLHSSVGTSVAFNAAGHLLASASGDGSLVVVDLRMWGVVMRYHGNTPLMSACFLPPCADGRECVVASGQDGNLWGFDLAQGGSLQQLTPYASPALGGCAMLCVDASRDGQRLACGGELAQVSGGYEGCAALDAALGAHREAITLADADAEDYSDIVMTNNPANQMNQSARALIGIWECAAP